MTKGNIKVRAVYIRVPFWLKWFKRFIRLEIKEHELPKTLRGRKIDIVIIDEVSNKDMIFRDYNVGADFIINGKNSKIIKR